jgi:hypothetical protein
MKSFLGLSLVGLLASTASAHMEVTNPPPFRSKNNPHTTDIDYSMTNPLSQSGSDFPCKGYHSLLDTPQGASVADWQPGGTYSFSLAGSATHNGGSCQVSLSYDRGSTWTVIHSYIGNCPLRPDWSFTLPNDTPSGSALWAWSWWNNLGNREMYMNCAHVTIGGGRTNELGDVEVDADFNATIAERGPNDPFASRPKMFVANVGNGCSTVETFDVEFPNPGPDVSNESSKTGAPVGSCGARRAMALKA